MWPLATKLKTIVMKRKTFVDNSVNFNNFERSDNFKININMKKEYIQPRMEAIEIRNKSKILAGSVTNANSDGVFDPNVTGGSGDARSPEFEEMQNLLFGN